MTNGLSPEIQYVLLVFGLFVVPRALQRFRLPSALTCLGLGALLNVVFHLFHEDDTVKLLASLGIVSMFLFAGLEVSFKELKAGRTVLLQHVGIQLGTLTLTALGAGLLFGLQTRAALLFALAILTPSTGFILDSLQTMGISDEERFWVKSKAIASELVALGVLFFTIQSTSVGTLALSAGVLLAMVALLPPLFHGFIKLIVPFAPGTEFSFLVMVALLYAFITRELGVYYLVGAFVVGLTAVRMRKDLPELSSGRLRAGVELFASFFIPFYFFKAGLHLGPEDFTWRSLLVGFGLLLVVLPLRVGRVALHRMLALGESWKEGARVGTAVVPTLVFTIVIAEILQERFALSPDLFGGLMIYTVVNTLLPGYLLRLPAPEYDTPEVPGEANGQPAGGAPGGGAPVGGAPVGGAPAGAAPGAPPTGEPPAS